MDLTHHSQFIPLEPVRQLLQFEGFYLLVGLVLFAWLFYKILLRNASEERHRNLRSQFKSLFNHLFIFSTLFAMSFLIRGTSGQWVGAITMESYIGLAALFWGCLVFIRAARMLVLQYLFLGSMKYGVPLLLVNIFSLILSVFIFSWLLNSIFHVQLTHLLATSAVFSIVVGLALQDTLGNLFAGLALQIDKPFEIGDWIEVYSGGEKFVGQVEEISWRATVLKSLTEEWITIPNRSIGQGQILNYSIPNSYIWRSLLFRLPIGSNVAKVKQLLLDAAASEEIILKFPAPTVQISEVSEKGMGFKLGYGIKSYPDQYQLNDRLYTKIDERLRAEHLTLASPEYTIKVPASFSQGGAARES